ncbi:MAG: hypothetical protein HC903_08125 [Methylacidiphilales bacterium]|nr:hypothetical protein [Candidatus Methylacidiphilales bacterium]
MFVTSGNILSGCRWMFRIDALTLFRQQDLKMRSPKAGLPIANERAY